MILKAEQVQLYKYIVQESEVDKEIEYNLYLNLHYFSLCYLIYFPSKNSVLQ